MDLGEKLYFYRTRAGLSQGELAERLEVSRQSVSKWETGNSVPELDKLIRICEVYGITLDELVRGERGEGEATPSEDAEPEPARTLPQTPPAWVRPRREPETAPWRKTAGLILICCSALLFLLPACFGLGLAGLIIATPFALCGLVCFVFKRHIGLWCSWVVYTCVVGYLGFATGTYPFSFVAYIRVYQMLQGISLHVIMSLVMFVGLMLLVGITVWVFRDYKLPFTAKRVVLCSVLGAVLVALYVLPPILMHLFAQDGGSAAVRAISIFSNSTFMVQWGIITWLLTVFVPHIRVAIKNRKTRGV